MLTLWICGVQEPTSPPRQPGLPPGWKQIPDPDGRTFYYNTLTVCCPGSSCAIMPMQALSGGRCDLGTGIFATFGAASQGRSQWEKPD